MNRSIVRGLAIVLVAAVIIVVMFFLPAPEQDDHAHDGAVTDPWVLISHDPDTEHGTYLANGFISARILGDGVGSRDGRPLPCFMAGLYDNQKLLPIPTWSDLRFHDGEKQFKIDQRDHYLQRLLMKSGILVTTATWRSGKRTLEGSIEVIVSRAQPNVAMIFAVLSPNFDGELTVSAPLGNISDRFEKLSTEAADASWSAHPVPTRTLRTRNSRIVLALAQHLDADTDVKRPAGKISPSVTLPVTRDQKFMIYYHASLATGADGDSARQAALSELESAVG
ncbi:unnamed protein product, partial [marine sediment metagenome]